MAFPSFSLVSSSLVTPATPTQRHTMFLSSVDIPFRWLHYPLTVLFYRLDHRVPHAYDSWISRLKSSLSLALVAFYPWAGRLFEQQDDGRLALDCNDAGVEFLEVSVDEPFLSLEEDNFQHRHFFGQLAHLGDVLKWDRPDLPLLSVQVTRFKDDAGIAIGWTCSHAVADGHSVWHFMKSWTECARGTSISMPPLHMRTELRPEKLICPARVKGVRSVTEGACLDSPPPIVDLIQRHFHFSASLVKSLKHATAEDGGPASTSFEALCAHVWKHVTAAREVSDETKSGIFILVNFRQRLIPPLPDAYFGNALTGKLVKATAGELGRESLGKTAKRIHEMIISIDDKWCREMGGNMEVMDPRVVLEADAEEGMVRMSVGNSPRFPVYELDFGYGRPSNVQIPCLRGDGEIMLFAGKEGGGSVDVCIALPPLTMHRLLQNNAFP